MIPVRLFYSAGDRVYFRLTALTWHPSLDVLIRLKGRLWRIKTIIIDSDTNRLEVHIDTVAIEVLSHEHLLADGWQVYDGVPY